MGCGRQLPRGGGSSSRLGFHSRHPGACGLALPELTLSGTGRVGRVQLQVESPKSRARAGTWTGWAWSQSIHLVPRNVLNAKGDRLKRKRKTTTWSQPKVVKRVQRAGLIVLSVASHSSHFPRRWHQSCRLPQARGCRPMLSFLSSFVHPMLAAAGPIRKHTRLCAP